jgi:drug/metabolite transporter (DMT)-like permease
VFSFTQIVFAAGLGALLFAERPDGWMLAGGALVLGGAWLAGRPA